MVKKANKLMIILSVLTVAFVGVNSAETVATNVNAYETSNTIYLSVDWGYWDNSNDFPERLMVKRDGGNFQDNFADLLDNKTVIYGSKEVYINLKGSYNISFTDHHNKLYHNYVFASIYVDALILDDYYITFMLNGDYLGHLYVNEIQRELNNSEKFYIIRNNRPSDYQLGFDNGLRVGYDDGYDDGLDDGFYDGYNQGLDDGEVIGYQNGRAEYGIIFNGERRTAEWYGQYRYEQGFDYGRREYGIYFMNDWRNAEWYGNYMYNQGLNETDATGFRGLLTAVFGGLGDLLGIQLLPGVYLGAIVAVPLVFGIIFFILGKRKGD